MMFHFRIRLILTAFQAVGLLASMAYSANDLLPVIDSGKVSPSIMRSEKDIAWASNRFGLNQFQKLSAAAPDSNLCFSPLSASYALVMTYNGAGGQTRDAMASALELAAFPADFVDSAYAVLTSALTETNPAVTLNIANSIWYKAGLRIKPKFIDLSKNSFQALVSGIDFSKSDAAEIINQWVAFNTGNEIKTIVEPPIDPEIVMFLINAVYFKAAWMTTFDSSLTQLAPFSLPDGSEVDCMMMTKTDEYGYSESETYQAVDLPYGNGRFSMAVFLPRPGVTPNNLIQQLQNNQLSDRLKELEPAKLQLKLPRFKFTSDFGLNQSLKAMGMAVAFSPQADFSNMAEDKIWIDSVVQKTFIQVDEQGTEAAAATAVIMKKSFTPSMVVDHPFVFVIHDRVSESILFIGQVVNPVWEDE